MGKPVSAVGGGASAPVAAPTTQQAPVQQSPVQAPPTKGGGPTQQQPAKRLEIWPPAWGYRTGSFGESGARDAHGGAKWKSAWSAILANFSAGARGQVESVADTKQLFEGFLSKSHGKSKA